MPEGFLFSFSNGVARIPGPPLFLAKCPDVPPVCWATWKAPPLSSRPETPAVRDTNGQRCVPHQRSPECLSLLSNLERVAAFFPHSALPVGKI